jgi:hypothetical protein
MKDDANIIKIKHTAFKIELGNERFYEIMSNGFSSVVSNEDMAISLLFSKDRPVVFHDSSNPAKRLKITLVDVNLDDIK